MNDNGLEKPQGLLFWTDWNRVSSIAKQRISSHHVGAMARIAEIRRLGTVAILSLLVSGCGGCSPSSLDGGKSNGVGGKTDSNSAANSRDSGGPAKADDIYKRIGALPKDARNYEERDSYRLSDEHLAALKDYKAIEELNIGGCPNTTDTGIADAIVGRNLKVAVLSNTGAGDRTLEALGKCPNLRRADLGLCDRVTDAGLAKLALATGLEELDLSGCVGVTDLGLAALASLKNLRILDLSWCGKLSDAAIGAISSSAPLRVLRLNHTSVTDKALEGLAKSATLELVEVRDCPAVTQDGLTRFRNSGSKCRIVK